MLCATGSWPHPPARKEATRTSGTALLTRCPGFVAAAWFIAGIFVILAISATIYEVGCQLFRQWRQRGPGVWAMVVARELPSRSHSAAIRCGVHGALAVLAPAVLGGSWPVLLRHTHTG